MRLAPLKPGRAWCVLDEYDDGEIRRADDD
jgi:hypothetical protein